MMFSVVRLRDVTNSGPVVVAATYTRRRCPFDAFRDLRHLRAEPPRRSVTFL